MTTSRPPSKTRRHVATGLSIITLGCALLYWLAYAFVTAQVYAGVYAGPMLAMAVTMFTFPPALICAIVAVILVGWSDSRLAWVSCYSFTWPYIVMFHCVQWMWITSLFK